MKNESHPNNHNQGPTKAASNSKEGLSVFGLFHHLARTPQGKHLLRQYFLRPSLNLDVINDRLDAIQTFLRPENTSVVDTLVKSLKSVGNMRAILHKLRKGTTAGPSSPSSNVWATIRRVSIIYYVYKEYKG